MAIDLRALIRFFVDFERQILLEAPPGVSEIRPRAANQLLELFRAYLGAPITILGLDFYKNVDRLFPSANAETSSPPPREELASTVFIFGDQTTITKADVLIHHALNGKEEPIFNRCYRRFLALKEAFHVILRFEFLNQSMEYPDTPDAARWLLLVERLIYLPFAIIDFDDRKYPDGVKVEHAAELMAVLVMYPLDEVATDRARFLAAGDGKITNPDIMTVDLFPFADQYKVPQRYVNLLFRWENFDDMYALYRQLKAT